MTKKIRLLMIAMSLLMVIVSALGLAACKEAHTHTYADDWQSDANNHWHAATCEHTDEQGGVAKHIDANNDGECDVCKYRPLTVVIGGTYYFCENDVTDNQLYITFANGKWTDDEGLTGDYVINGNTVTLSMQVDNEKVDFATGVVNGDDIALNLMGTDVTYRKGEDISSKPKEKTLSFALSDDKNYYIVKGIGGLTGDIVVPDEYKRKPVKEIAESAFANQKGLTSIVVSDNVTSIGANAFNKCESLTEVTLGESVEAIAPSTFDGCSSLAKITIPASVKSIGYDAFKSCKALADVYFTGTVSDWAQIKFFAAGNIPQNSNPISSGINIIAGTVEKSLYIDNEVLTNAEITTATEITPVAFYSYKKLQSVTIGRSVKEIGRAAFSYCNNLSSLDMSNSTATVIGIYAFSGCNALETVGISNSVKKLDEGAFMSCEKLSNVSIGNGVTYLGKGAFMSCEKLSDLTMGNSVAEICEDAFYECRALTTVTIPASAIFIGREAFSYTKLTSATFESTTGWIANKHDALTSEQLSDKENAAKLLILSVLDKDNKGYVEAEWEKPTLTYTLSSDGTYYIVNNSGTVCRSEITIPEKYNDKPVRALAADAFKNCKSLVSITLTGAIMSIPSGAFDGCTSLESITVTGYLSGGYELVYGTKDGVLYNADFTQIIYIPLAKTEITISGITEIADEMFKNNTSLKNVIIADGVTKIGDSAFYGCTNLTGITIPDSVTEIGASAFYNCTSLTSITIPDGVTEIKNGTFLDCSSLANVTIPDTVTKIGSHAFRRCGNITSIVVPVNVVSISSSAFYECFKLREVYNLSKLEITCGAENNGYIAYYAKNVYSAMSGQSNITAIKDGYVFYIDNDKVYLVGYNGNEKDIILPSSFNGKSYVISSYAFYNCSNLHSVVIPRSILEIESDVFWGCENLIVLCEIESQPDSWSWGWNIVNSEGFTGARTLTHYGIKILENGLVYTVKDNEVTIVSYMGKESVVNLPTKIEEMLVTGIYERAFKDLSYLANITIPDSVTSIGLNAFYNCSNLISIAIPKNVKTIGNSAFASCINLETVYWNAIACTYAGSYAKYNNNVIFENCNKLTSVIIGDEVIEIPNYVFYGCTGIEKVYNNGNINTWCSIDFKNSYSNPLYSSDIAVLYFNNEVLSEELIIPDDVTNIPAYAFKNCSEITSVTIGASVTKIGTKAFVGCGIDTVYWNAIDCISSGGDSYGAAFGVTTAIIGDDVVSIPAFTFSDRHLKNLTIGKSVTTIDSFVLGYGGSTSSHLISNIYYTGDLVGWCKISCHLMSYTTNDAYLHINNEILSGDVVIPEGVTGIPAYTFKNSNITSITIPNSVTTIWNGAFYNCSSLTRVYYTGDLESWCNISFGGGVTNVSYTSNPLSFAHNLYIDNELVTELVIPDTVTEIKKYAFYGCTSITSVTIADGVLSIGNSTFEGCSSMTSVTIPDSVITIDKYAFANCSSLTSVTIGNSVTSIGACVFLGCSSITSVYYTGDLASWCNISFGIIGNASDAESYSSNPLLSGANLYIDNELLTEVVIPDTITEIKRGTFYGCTSIISVVIGNSVTKIGENSFRNCSSLISVTIGKNVKEIYPKTFYNCRKLTEIKFAGTVKQWDAIIKYEGQNADAIWNYRVPATKVICSDGYVSL